MKKILMILLLLCAAGAFAREIPVASDESLERAVQRASKGDTIRLRILGQDRLHLRQHRAGDWGLIRLHFEHQSHRPPSRAMIFALTSASSSGETRPFLAALRATQSRLLT